MRAQCESLSRMGVTGLPPLYFACISHIYLRSTHVIMEPNDLTQLLVPAQRRQRVKTLNSSPQPIYYDSTSSLPG